ncbi:MAG: hypothetical protein R8N24_01465 [Alphaproteobacteria bacterium]|nr:hypothetical protein [Alphaproteobacteria bacterium]
MITHDTIWTAIDKMAERQNISASRLAIISGLNATTFNKSKRYDAYGKSRYPSFSTIAKVLNTSKMTMTEFGKICDKCQQNSQ